MLDWGFLFQAFQLAWVLLPVIGVIMFFGLLIYAEKQENEKAREALMTWAMTCLFGVLIAVVGLGMVSYVGLENKNMVSKLKYDIPLYSEDVDACIIYYNVTAEQYIDYVKKYNVRPPMERVLIICGNKIEYADTNNTYVQEFLKKVEEEQKLTPDEEMKQALGWALLYIGDGIILFSGFSELYVVKKK